MDLRTKIKKCICLLLCFILFISPISSSPTTGHRKRIAQDKNLSSKTLAPKSIFQTIALPNDLSYYLFHAPPSLRKLLQNEEIEFKTLNHFLNVLRDATFPISEAEIRRQLAKGQPFRAITQEVLSLTGHQSILRRIEMKEKLLAKLASLKPYLKLSLFSSILAFVAYTNFAFLAYRDFVELTQSHLVRYAGYLLLGASIVGFVWAGRNFLKRLSKVFSPTKLKKKIGNILRFSVISLLVAYSYLSIEGDRNIKEDSKDFFFQAMHYMHGGGQLDTTLTPQVVIQPQVEGMKYSKFHIAQEGRLLDTDISLNVVECNPFQNKNLELSLLTNRELNTDYISMDSVNISRPNVVSAITGSFCSFGRTRGLEVRDGLLTSNGRVDKQILVLDLGEKAVNDIIKAGLLQQKKGDSEYLYWNHQVLSKGLKGLQEWLSTHSISEKHHSALEAFFDMSNIYIDNQQEKYVYEAIMYLDNDGGFHVVDTHDIDAIGFDPNTQGDTHLIFKDGTQSDTIKDALQTGPLLIRNNQSMIESDSQTEYDKHPDEKRGKVAYGVDKKGKYYFFTSDAHGGLLGLNYKEFSEVVLKYGRDHNIEWDAVVCGDGGTNSNCLLEGKKITSGGNSYHTNIWTIRDKSQNNQFQYENYMPSDSIQTSGQERVEPSTQNKQVKEREVSFPNRSTNGPFTLLISFLAASFTALSLYQFKRQGKNFILKSIFERLGLKTSLPFYQNNSRKKKAFKSRKSFEKSGRSA